MLFRLSGTPGVSAGPNSNGALPDPLELEAALKRYGIQLYAYVLAALRNPHDAEDVLQEVMIRALKRPDFNSITNQPIWLRQIARYCILDHVRRSGKRAEIISSDLLNELEIAAESVETEEPPEKRFAALKQCINRLKGPGRTVLELHYEKAFEVEQIARMIKKSLRATYQLLYRARIAIRNCMRFKSRQ